MILLLLLIVSASAFNEDEMRVGAQSPAGKVQLFRSLTEKLGASYGPEERNLRLQVFSKRLPYIVETNAAQDMYVLDANFMAVLTDEEQKQWYGINITARPAEIVVEENMVHSMPAASSKLWRGEGIVTRVKNQGTCGSCWAFAGVGSFEGHYAIKTGGLKQFSEQQMLDCTYAGTSYDGQGCKGGWYWEAYAIVKRDQHLALEKDYTYNGRDGTCLTRSKPNGMTAARFKGTARPAKSSGDYNLVQALMQGPVAMAFEVAGGFNYYKSGVLSIYNCGSTPHHAMEVTGYTPAYFEMKNSWGAYWGDAGYVRFDRRIENMCGISNWNAYPILEKTGDDDNEDVTPTEENNNDGGDNNVDCNDGHVHCQAWANRGECRDTFIYMSEYCKKSCNICGCSDGFDDCVKWKSSGYCTSYYTSFMEKMCRKSCGLCTDDGGNNQCPSGLTFCNGKCQHEHFC